MTEVSLVKRLLILAAGSLLILSAAACQREKPPAVEPTLPIPTVVGQAVTTPAPTTGAVAPPTIALSTTPGAVQTLAPGAVATNTPVVVTTAQPPTASQTSVAPTAAPGASGTGTTTYTVQLGDTLYAIAAKYGVTIEQIQAANPGLNPNLLVPGTVLIIPAPAAPGASTAGGAATPTPLGLATAVPSTGTSATPSTGTTAGACPARYTVQRGDWWYEIARKCGVTVEALQKANPGVNSRVVYPGQVLNIPGGSGTTPSSPPAGSTSTYTVQAGDTLFGIAVRFGKTVYALQVANHLANPNAIYVGQVLIIPQ